MASEQNKQYISVFTHRGKVYDTYRTQEGKFTKEVNSNYEFFIEDQNPNCDYTDIFTRTKTFKRISASSVKEFNTKLEKMKNYNIEPWCTQKPQDQYRYKTYYKEPKTITPHFCVFDIETGFNGSFLKEDGNLDYGNGAFPKAQDANSSIVSIVLYSFTKKKYYCFGVKDFKIPEGRDDIKYKKCISEKDILKSFFKTINILGTDLLSAWNSDEFDFPYIINRMKKLNIPLSIISPFLNKPRNTDLKHSFEKPKDYYFMDYMEIYKKFIFTPRERYSLDFIAKAELGNGKVQYNEDYLTKVLYTDGTEEVLQGLNNSVEIGTKINDRTVKDFQNKIITLEELYNIDFQKFMEYNIRDVEIMVELDNKLNLLALVFELSYNYNINMGDVFGTVYPWGNKTYCESMERGYLLPKDFKYKNEEVDFEGGYVFCAPGSYNWVMSFDFASLYPSIIRAYNLCPSTYIPDADLPQELKKLQNKYFSDREAEYGSISKIIECSLEEKDEICNVCEKYNVSITPTGDFFDISKEGMIPEIIENIYKERKKYKNEMLLHQRNVEKIKEVLEGKRK